MDLFLRKQYIMSIEFGYDPGLQGGVRVPLPTLQPSLLKQTINNGELFNHLHFSLMMSSDPQRKIPIFVAHSFDGGAYIKVPRPPQNAWNYDRLFAKEKQLVKIFYKGKVYDIGHFAPASYSQGKTLEEAIAAAWATFVYSNAAPQHQSFNRDEWKSLEEMLLIFAIAHKLKEVIFTGPVLGSRDILNNGILIPCSYWKVVCFSHPTLNIPLSVGFLMDQTEMWGENALEPAIDLTAYQVPIKRIQILTRLDFGVVNQWDSFNNVFTSLNSLYNTRLNRKLD